VRPVQSSLRQVSEAPEDAVNYALLRDGMYPEPIGQVARCYILASMGHDLLIIDQHAAHERLMYLKFANRRRAAPSQPLLIPVSVDVPAPAVSYMNRLAPVFEELGLKIDHFGGQTYLVQSVPADLAHINVAAVIADLLDDFEALGKVEQVEVLRDRIITRMACRAAVKAGQQLHLDEMRALIRDIANARLGFTCPHGRPTMVLMTRDALDKQFKRKV
jgi:DNA mismatch repair protein MutL